MWIYAFERNICVSHVQFMRVESIADTCALTNVNPKRHQTYTH